MTDRPDVRHNKLIRMVIEMELERRSEREHWLSITDDPEWRRNHISDPNISEDETIQAIVSVFPADPERILEIGCGYGRLTSKIADRFPDAMVTGTDINGAVLVEAIPGAAYAVRDNLTGLPVQDAIYSVAVFQHLPDAEKYAYIKQSAEILRPGGVLRVQFIQGQRRNFCDHWVTREQMAEWLFISGFTSCEFDDGLAHPQWTWVTAVK